MNPVQIARRLKKDLAPLRFSTPVTHVYNPLDYAAQAHENYLERFCRPTCSIVLLGMNPGPWGMAQTGVPFGEVGLVRDWLKVTGKIRKPDNEHPKRPIQGFECERSEVSGARLWGWAKERFGTPSAFSKRFFIANYCPLTFMEETGRNRTPDKLPAAERDALTEICDQALRRLIEHIDPKWVIGVGGYAETRATKALAGMELQIGRVLHPSPASPIANRGWAQQATKDFAKLGIKIPAKKS